MLRKFRNAIQVVIGVVLVAQLTGCYRGSDRHYHPWWHHDEVVDVHMHG